jgi:hypothetical protein
MLLTAEQARALECPLRVALIEDVEVGFCRAARCPLWRWRWAEPPTVAVVALSAYDLAVSCSPATAAIAHVAQEPRPNRKGYCGLGGKPDHA